MTRRVKAFDRLPAARQAEILANEARKKKRERAAHDARRLGLPHIPNQLWYRHPWGCECYDCLWGDGAQFGQPRPARIMQVAR